METTREFRMYHLDDVDRFGSINAAILFEFITSRINYFKKPIQLKNSTITRHTKLTSKMIARAKKKIMAAKGDLHWKSTFGNKTKFGNSLYQAQKGSDVVDITSETKGRSLRDIENTTSATKGSWSSTTKGRSLEDNTVENDSINDKRSMHQRQKVDASATKGRYSNGEKYGETSLDSPLHGFLKKKKSTNVDKKEKELQPWEIPVNEAREVEDQNIIDWLKQKSMAVRSELGLEFNDINGERKFRRVQPEEFYQKPDEDL